MTDIAFYHLTKFSLEQALPKLLEKTLQVGKRAVVQVSSKERAEALANDLWTYSAESWLPHGTQKDGHAEKQPIWITPETENPNGAQFLFLSEGTQSSELPSYERCFVVFDGRSDMAVQKAREQWKTYKDGGHELAYWQQTDTGGWEKKA
ncbi:DNA polymerase III subunit chi [Candidatus Terasakiella magnetica]|uniref:DNA polymerase III subunit chi n=1 Tax=Candidatus Terasakiella magnetica TaxID=1867952 RepID=A0A1C3RK19_9PROT|nr:DNA polymerase III subunit chi [Candidatus Terasakiella magnetica]SCA57615.1 DNA polymerase III subunit chi [Candidatus Terasakiella magnetica]